jgi:hypothetical protein
MVLLPEAPLHARGVRSSIESNLLLLLAQAAEAVGQGETF